MKTPMLAGWLGSLSLTVALLPVASSSAQDSTRRSDSVAAIDADFGRSLRQLERQRIERLARLAEQQPADEAAATYLVLFQDALAAGLYRDSEPIAERILQQGNAPPQLRYLANLTNILAEVDRGAFEESLKSIEAAIAAGKKHAKADDPALAGAVLPEAVRLSLVETYYQRLVQAAQFDIARRAFSLIRDEAPDPRMREYAAGRLNRLAMIGKPAPPIVGTDVDGKPFDLAKLKGQVILVDFWATWCLPCAVQAVQLDDLRDRYYDQGFRVVGINLDSLDQNASKDPSDHLPAVRRFLIEHNVRWPNLLNGPDARDFAHAYGVNEIPVNFLIGPDGNIIAVDLIGTSLESAVQKALKSK